jgi:hypothetical protein
MNATTPSSRFASIDLEPSKASSKNRKARKGKPRPATHADNLRRWATSGIGLTLGLSAVLNAYSYVIALTDRTAGLVAGVVLLGIAIPLLVLIFSEVAGILFHRKQRSLAYATGAASLGLLVLSIWHCSTAIAGLTSSPIFLALPLAVAVDAGLVCCKLALLVA